MPLDFFLFKHQTHNVKIDFSIVNLNQSINQKMDSWSFTVLFWLQNILFQGWSFNVYEENSCKKVLWNLVKEIQNFNDFIPWFIWLYDVFDVFLIHFCDRINLDDELSPLIFIRNAANNEFIQRIA